MKLRHILLPLLSIAVVATPLIAANPSAHAPKAVVDIPDMDKIKAEITDPKSRYWYPKLMKQYEQNETVMKLDDYRHLYLGALFQEDYNPYRRQPLDNQLDRLYYQQKHSRAELDSIISWAEAALLDDPFDLSQINFLIYALRNRGKNNRANIWQYRLNHLLEAILSTGNGSDPEHAWIVIDPKHEYDILNFQKAVVDKAEFIQPYYDCISVTGADSQPHTYYFNVNYLLREYYRKHPDEAFQ